ncbi:glycine--tRNA ligase-like isoform X1 [Penaeus japonicus]|uniref:glycine--tRNA ligase-like isoform X1 n=1 Tax=Penaeus japonicus TaxID=27405 RepID=UPI001C70DC41|nr:glycine--tRNA ligase-like isoform X1 [Penaeus japonicus]
MNPLRALVAVACSTVTLRLRSTAPLKSLRSITTFCPFRKQESVAWGSKKHAARRKVQLQSALLAMDPAVEEQLAPLRARCKEQGDKVRKMKADGATEIDIKREVQELKARKKELEDTILKLSPPDTFDRAKMNDLIKRRFFYDNSFAIYGGITGQYDFGPMGCDLVDNMMGEWHKHFVIQERMLKVNCSILTPEPVLKASGHVDKFADYMVKDVSTGECFRLDHLIKQHFEKIKSDKKTSQEEKEGIERKITLLDGMTMEEMDKIVKDYKMKSPLTGNDLTDAVEFNLMFPISIGPSGALKGFLRPETAQGIFVNFKRLLEYNQGKLPFACAQVGNAYRNEISPRTGLLRVREFMMAEIEHFCDPDDKSHPKFSQIADLQMRFYSACAQMDGESEKMMTIGEAVHGSGPPSLGSLSTPSELGALDFLLSSQSYILGHEPTQVDVTVYEALKESPPPHLPHAARWYRHLDSFKASERQNFTGKKQTLQQLTGGKYKGMVANETLGYYMARIYQYLLKIGINPKKLRFRQHLSNEMAHYACDCWDAECLTSYGWIECVGCADRSAYDLGQHTKASGVRLSVERPLKEPRIVDTVVALPDKGAIGKTFKKDAKAVQEALVSLSNEEAEKMDKALSEAGEYELNGFKLTRAMVPNFKREQKKVHVEEYIPSVIEPSFGVGRVFYSLLEHSFRVREDDDKKTYFSLPAIVAPVKVSVLPLSNKSEFIPFTVQLANALTELNISSRIDDSTGSIGRRYARTDEIAIPFGVTIDFDTCNNTPHTVTLRERDSTEQVRIPIEEVAPTVRLLADGKMEWKAVTDKWPKFVAQETTK